MEIIWGHLLDANMFYLYYADAPIAIKGNLWQMKKLSYRVASVIISHSKKRKTVNTYNEICMEAEDRMDKFLEPIRAEYEAMGLTDHEAMSQIVARIAEIFTRVLVFSLNRLENVCQFKLKNKSLESLNEFNSRMSKHLKNTNRQIVGSKVLDKEWAKIEKSLCSEFVVEKIIAKPLRKPNDNQNQNIKPSDQANK